MVKRNFAFTIVELMISLSISSFILLFLMQSYKTVSNFIDKSKSSQNINRRVCLAINQIEKDVSAAFIPFLNEVESADGKTKDKASPKNEEADKEEKKYFVAKSVMADFVKIENEKKHPFECLNFITTNPLQVYGEKRPRLVRVKYELLKDKSVKRDKESYNFFRLETDDLSNFEFKTEDDRRDKKKQVSVRRHLVLAGVKNMFFEYVSVKEKKKDEPEVFSRSDKNKEELIRKFLWQTEDTESKDDETKEVVPRQVEIWFSIWDEKFESDYPFKLSIPIFSYPTLKPDLTKTGTGRKRDGAPAASNVTANVAPGTPGRVARAPRVAPMPGGM